MMSGAFIYRYLRSVLGGARMFLVIILVPSICTRGRIGVFCVHRSFTVSFCYSLPYAFISFSLMVRGGVIGSGCTTH